MTLKRLLLGVLLTILTVFTAHQVEVYAADADELIVHYYRYDDDYTDWSIWLWQDGISGVEVQFDSQDSYGKVATIDLSDNNFVITQDIGIIIAQIPEWNKDIDMDRYIDLSQPNGAGEVHAYLLQGEEFISYVDTDQPGCNPDIPSPYLCAQQLRSGLVDAYFDGSLNLRFVSTESVDASDISVYRDTTEVGFSGFVSGSSGTLTLNQTVDVSDVYTIEIDYNGTLVEQVVRVNADYDSALFATAYHYDGPLGIDYSPAETTFRIWAPVSSSASVNLYHAGHSTAIRADGADAPFQVVEMDYTGSGVWAVTVVGDLNGVYYTYDVINSGSKVSGIQDPYGVSFGLNGQRSMVLDLDATDPEGWDTDEGIDGYTNPNEAIIYELHVRDLTSQDAWGGTPAYQGTYMGFTERGTTYTNPLTDVTVTTGLDHLIELGITHVHLLPTYDQDWNDERNFQFNWGYNPQHYNSPEGGYSTDPYDGAVRVNEFKQMVQALHDGGINVILDKVYNHTGPGGNYSYNRIVPDYFYRFNPDGSYSNGTGVGNETASERYMFNKFMVDSMVYWAEEYHIDGFRFDLMAVHDYETMNDVSAAVEAIDPDIFVYGEPWGGGTIALNYNLQAGKNNLYRMPLISAFNDDLRNAIKGSPDGSDGGYITTGLNVFTVMDGIAGDLIGTTSSQSINYVTAHDNLTLYDKLKLVNNSTGYTTTIDYEARLANGIVLFSQGIPFLHAGVDFLRTKGGNHNSYNASDLVNQLSWVRKSMYVDSFEYYKGIIEIRKEFDSFKMQTRADIDANLEFLNPAGFGLIGYRLTKNSEDILIYHNSGKQTNDITLPSGAWTLIADRDEAGLDPLGTYQTRYPIEEAETLVFIPGNVADVQPSPTFAPEITNVFNVVFEGGTFNLTATTNIHAYSINGGEYVTVASPMLSVPITGLTVGFHTIRIKDEFGSVSPVFTIQVLANNDPVVCEDGYSEVDGECVVDPLVCDDGYSEVDGECVIDEVVCDTGYELVDDQCQLIEEPNPDPDPDGKTFEQTGCFGGLRMSSILIPAMISMVGMGLLFLRKR